MIPFNPQPEKRIYRLSDEEAKAHFTSFCPDPDYEPGLDPERDLDLLQKTNAAWQILAALKGFKWETVEPHPSGSPLLFYAAPKEN